MDRNLWRLVAAYWLGLKQKPAPDLFGMLANLPFGVSPVEAAVVDAPQACADTTAVSPVLSAEPEAQTATRDLRLSVRLRSVARLNKSKSRLRAARRHKTKLKSEKRAPQLYPVKTKKLVAKRAKTKIIVQKPKTSAVILRFPVRPQRAAVARQRRVA